MQCIAYVCPNEDSHYSTWYSVFELQLCIVCSYCRLFVASSMTKEYVQYLLWPVLTKKLFTYTFERVCVYFQGRKLVRYYVYLIKGVE